MNSYGLTATEPDEAINVDLSTGQAPCKRHFDRETDNSDVSIASSDRSLFDLDDIVIPYHENGKRFFRISISK